MSTGFNAVIFIIGLVVGIILGIFMAATVIANAIAEIEEYGDYEFRVQGHEYVIRKED